MAQIARRFKTKPLQTFLTVAQVLLGSFAMTFALSAYLTPEDTMEADRFYLRAGDKDESGWMMTPLFLEEDLPEILSLTDVVADLAIYDLSFNPEVSYNGQKIRFAWGANVSANYFNIVDVGITSGSVFGSAEAEKQDPVVVLSENSARATFGDADPIGKELKTVTTTYRVIGVFDDVVGRTIYGRPGIYFPVWAKGPHEWMVDGSFQGFTGLVVQAKRGQSSAATEQMLAAVRFVYKHNPVVSGQPEGRDFYTEKSREVDSIESKVNPIFIILGLFGIVALVISSIGMFSNTFVDITKRTHEIGINRALGATSNHIGRLFSLEAALLSFFGSVLGAALTALLMPLLIKPLEASYLYGSRRLLWQPEAALIVIAVAVLLGTLLAFVPAFRAGKMKPIEALRSI